MEEEIKKQTKKQQKEIEMLRKENKNSLADCLENIATSLKEMNAKKIENVFFARKEKSEKENKEILLRAIESTKTLFALKETVNLYNELIKIDPSAENHFNYAYFMQENNQFKEAEKSYVEALEKYRELAKKNPEVYLPYVAMILNNLGLLQSDTNRHEEAEKSYDKEYVGGKRG